MRSRRKLPRNSSRMKLGCVHSASRDASATFRDSRSLVSGALAVAILTSVNESPFSYNLPHISAATQPAAFLPAALTALLRGGTTHLSFPGFPHGSDVVHEPGSRPPADPGRHPRPPRPCRRRDRRRNGFRLRR